MAGLFDQPPSTGEVFAADPVRGQVVKATVVLARGRQGVDFVTELPKTISGKIRQVEIRRRDSDR